MDITAARKAQASRADVFVRETGDDHPTALQAGVISRVSERTNRVYLNGREILGWYPLHEVFTADDIKAGRDRKPGIDTTTVAVQRVTPRTTKPAPVKLSDAEKAAGWGAHTMKVGNRTVEFKRNIKTGITRVSGMQEFTTTSVTDARWLITLVYDRFFPQG